MEKLKQVFEGLQGDHIPKVSQHQNQTDGQETSQGPAPMAEGIDCCDVNDTCCDSYD